MSEDQVIQEVRRVKEEIAARHGHDVRAIARAAQECRKALGREAVSRPPKRVVRR